MINYNFFKKRNLTQIVLFSSTLRQSRPNKAGLKYQSVRAYVRNVRTYATCVRTQRAYVRPSVSLSTEVSLISIKFGIGRGR